MLQFSFFNKRNNDNILSLLQANNEKRSVRFLTMSRKDRE